MIPVLIFRTDAINIIALVKSSKAYRFCNSASFSRNLESGSNSVPKKKIKVKALVILLALLMSSLCCAINSSQFLKMSTISEFALLLLTRCFSNSSFILPICGRAPLLVSSSAYSYNHSILAFVNNLGKIMLVLRYCKTKRKCAIK